MERIMLPKVIINASPSAAADIAAARGYGVSGKVWFWPFQEGSIVMYSINGLPGEGFHGFHIHAFPVSGGDLATAGSHYDDGSRQHPWHRGDMPPLLSGRGFAHGFFYTNRFSPEEVAERSVIIHSGPDDFSSDPSGHSGARIAYGNIKLL